MWKVYDNNIDDNDDDGQRTDLNQKSSLEPLGQVSLKVHEGLCLQEFTAYRTSKEMHKKISYPKHK